MPDLKDSLYENATVINEIAGCVMTTIVATVPSGDAGATTAAAPQNMPDDVLLSEVYRAHAEHLRGYAAQLDTKAEQLHKRERNDPRLAGRHRPR